MKNVRLAVMMFVLFLMLPAWAMLAYMPTWSVSSAIALAVALAPAVFINPKGPK